MSWLYPHRVKLLRPQGAPALGATQYRGSRRGNEELIAEELSAAIQLKGEGPKPAGGLPADTANRTLWRVLIPRSALQGIEVKLRDVIVDAAGVRYQVLGPYTTPLGANLLCERLEV
ncbi:MAG: hypothetical protein ACREUT_20335 [Steroidobacteraceae bacterium]